MGVLRWERRERRYMLSIRGRSMFLRGAGDPEDQNQAVGRVEGGRHDEYTCMWYLFNAREIMRMQWERIPQI